VLENRKVHVQIEHMPIFIPIEDCVKISISSNISSNILNCNGHKILFRGPREIFHCMSGSTYPYVVYGACEVFCIVMDLVRVGGPQTNFLVSQICPLIVKITIISSNTDLTYFDHMFKMNTSFNF
jgi:hypothetical protein